MDNLIKNHNTKVGIPLASFPYVSAVHCTKLPQLLFRSMLCQNLEHAEIMSFVQLPLDIWIQVVACCKNYLPCSVLSFRNFQLFFLAHCCCCHFFPFSRRNFPYIAVYLLVGNEIIKVYTFIIAYYVYLFKYSCCLESAIEFNTKAPA